MTLSLYLAKLGLNMFLIPKDECKIGIYLCSNFDKFWYSNFKNE